jgi:hypothetical protein
MEPAVKIIADQPSWVVRSDTVELAVTQLGGHMAPVTFYRGTRRPVRPYYVSPWQGERLKIGEPVLVPLRGDFFCMPFAGGSLRGETHPVHGDPATLRWHPVSLQRTGKTLSLKLSMKTRIRPGRITKKLSLVDGQNVVYCRHVLEGFSGAMPLGHHATLAMPEAPRTVRIDTSPFRLGMTYPMPCGDPAIGEYYTVQVAKRFTDLSRVPLNRKDQTSGSFADLPDRKGHCDLVAVFHKPSELPAWTTAIFLKEGFLWFSLKDPAVLPTLMLWVENHGRHTSPWLGRNNCLGLEDLCGYFACGLGESVRPNVLNKAGIPTAVKLSPRRPTVISYIQGVVKVPPGFRCVRKAEFRPGRVTFVSSAGRKVSAAVNWSFLAGGEV